MQRCLWVLFLCTTIPLLSYAETLPNKELMIENRIRQALPSTAIRSVTGSVIPGLYEIEAGNRIYYVDSTARYLVVGHLYDLQNARDLTQAKLDKLKSLTSGIDTGLFPTEARLVFGQGSKTLTVLFDPDCGWCKKLYAELEQLSDLQVHLVFAVPSDRADMAASILCVKKSRHRLEQYMSGEPLPTSNRNACLDKTRQALAEVRSITQSLGLSGTPILISPTGQPRPGFLSKTAIEEWLNLEGSKTNDH